jgi:DNA-binding NtrC family response regulator/Tfp pilus assembly protein PilF
MEDILKNRFSELSQIEESLSSVLYKGFDNLFQRNVILKILFPIATKDISLLTLLAQLYHRNIASPIDLIPLPGGYYCVVFPEYSRNLISKNDLEEENNLPLALQALSAIEFLFSKSIGINNISERNLSKDNGIIYLIEFEENIYRLPHFEDKIKKDSIENIISRFPCFINSSLIEKKEIFSKIMEENPYLIYSLLGFDLRRKEDQIIDGFADEKGSSNTKVLGIFGREGQGKSVFLKNFIIRNRSISSPIIFLNSMGREDFFNSFIKQLSWLYPPSKTSPSALKSYDGIVRLIELLFLENGISSLIFIFEDIDRADFERVKFLEKLFYAIDDSYPFKIIFTSESYFPLLKDLRAYHLNLSFRNLNEFRENLWLGNPHLEDFVEIAWRKSGGNLNLFHWILKDLEFWKKGERYKEKDYLRKDLLKNYSKEEAKFLHLVSCFPKGFEISWLKSLKQYKIEDFNSLINKEILERKGMRLFVKEPWLSTIQEAMSEEEKKEIHNSVANIDRENSYYHLFMAGRYEEGVEELQKFIENLENKGHIKEAIDLAMSFQEHVDKVKDSLKKFYFYSSISELYLKIGDFDIAFQYIAKSSQFVKPSSEEWMKLKVKISECLYGMMKHGKAVNILRKSIKFAEIYKFEKYVNAFNYQLSKSLWKMGKYEESENILKNLEGSEDKFYSGISKRDRGYYYFLRGDTSGKELVESSLKLLHDYPREEALSFKYLACIYMKEKKWDEALKLFSKAMRIFEKENDLFNQAGLCSDIGKLYLEREDFLSSEVWFKKAFEIYSKIENPRGITLSQFNLTEVMIPSGKWQNAKEILHRCAEIDKNSQNLFSYAYDINSLGYLEFLTGNFNNAKKLLKESEEIFESYNAKKELVDTKIKILELLLENGEFNETKKIIEEIEKMNFSEDDIREILNYKILKAKYFLKKKESGKAEKIVSEIIDEAIKYDLKTILGNAFLLKALILKDKEGEESFENFSKSLETFNKLNNNFSSNIATVEFYINFPDKVDLYKAKEALEWLREREYFKYPQYEESIFPKEKPSNSIKLLKFLLDIGRFDWIKIFTLSSGKLSLEEEFPTLDFEPYINIDISTLVPKTLRIDDYEVLQIPIIKSGILKGFLLCGKKEHIEIDSVGQILPFIEPVYTFFYKKENEEKDWVGLEPRIIGGSSVKRIMDIINKIKDFNYPVLVIGESGTGKELIARYIHNLSSRRNGPFIPVNCSALPEHLLESELFGWVKGAFTGANTERKGLIEEADGGTFFLDEIGDLPFSLQAKLLRVLQEKETRRLGENKIRKVDVRIISATNKNLEEEIREKRFREDLYYRIKGVVIYIPPLRVRKEDIPLLANYFIEKYCDEMGRERVHLSLDALEAIISYHWPGNVRELETEIRNTIMLLEPGKKIIDINDLPPTIASKKIIKLDIGGDYDLATAKEIFEKNYIEEVLKRNDWNRKKTAEALKITRQGLFKLMKKYRIIKEDNE